MKRFLVKLIPIKTKGNVYKIGSLDILSLSPQYYPPRTCWAFFSFGGILR